MPADLQSIADPQFIVLAWAAGLAAVAGAVTLSRIVGPGFTWLSAGVAALLSAPGALATAGWPARAALALIAVAVVTARNHPIPAAALFLGAVLLAVQAFSGSGPLPSLTAALALGGVTGEMMLGHWYLIDPRLPRAALRGLAVVGTVGLIADGLMLSSASLPGGGSTVAYWVLLATSVGLMAAVVAALRYPAYSGVMAATGLSYLAVLTTLGSVFLGRALVAGLGPFTT